MRRHTKNLASVTAACVLLFTCPVMSSPDTGFEVSGFGTLGYAVLDEDGVEYRLGKALDGVTSSGSLKFDSRLGVQLDARLSPRVNATVQALVRDNQDGEFRPDLEWAFFRAPLNDTWTARVGRMSLPFFNLSDFRDVGYANEMMRPPEDTYVQSPLRHFDGADLVGQFEIGETLVTAQMLAGRLSEDIYNDATAESGLLTGLNVSFSRGIARVRASHLRAPISIDVPAHQPLIAGLQQIAPLVPAAAAIADELSDKRQKLSFSGIAVELDFDRVFIDVEYTIRTARSFVLDSSGWYVSAGYRIDNWTPYAFVSGIDQREDAPVLILPPDPSLTALSAGLDLIYTAPDQSSSGVGARWDLKPNMALKLQLENIQRKSIGTSFLRSTDNLTLDQGNNVNLFSIGLDFLFEITDSKKNFSNSARHVIGVDGSYQLACYACYRIV